jgi:hypothetical protein
MKKITMLVASVLVSTFALASEPGEGSVSTGLAVVKKNETTFNLFYKSEGSMKVKVSITDAAGNEVLSEWVKHQNGFIRPYNFYGMDAGEYTITVKEGETKKEERLTYGEAKVAKAAKVIKIDNNRYMLAVHGNKALGGILVKIYDGGTLIHKGFHDVSGDFAQLFTIKENINQVTFEVCDNEGRKIN